jgi:hypothetical protein
VILETPPDPTRASSFLNIRVADIQAVYDEWRARRAEFITEHVGIEGAGALGVLGDDEAREQDALARAGTLGHRVLSFGG